ncbi:nuclear transport factor 2 family protein [Streptomyces griseoruber]
MERNKHAVEGLFEIIYGSTEGLDRLDEFVAEDYVQHNPNLAQGREGLREFFTHVLSLPPSERLDSTKTVTVNLVAERDLVLRHEIRTDGVLFDLFRVKDGLLQEHWDAFRPNPDTPQSSKHCGDARLRDLLSDAPMLHELSVLNAPYVDDRQIWAPVREFHVQVKGNHLPITDDPLDRGPAALRRFFFQIGDGAFPALPGIGVVLDIVFNGVPLEGLASAMSLKGREETFEHLTTCRDGHWLASWCNAPSKWHIAATNVHVSRRDSHRALL